MMTTGAETSKTATESVPHPDSHDDERGSAAPSHDYDSQPVPQKKTKKTRFVLISDTHNKNVKLPKGDVLIHAGDLTNKGGHSEMQRTLEWLDKADYECKIIVAGNHDLTFDIGFSTQYPTLLTNQSHTPSQCRSLLQTYTTLTYLHHEYRTITLTSPTGPRTSFRLFASPLSLEFGIWAFMYDRAHGARVWDCIPLDTDVLVTHGPAYGFRDFVPRNGENVGCEGLREALWRARPRLAVCGHIHESRGAERVRWRLDGGGEGERYGVEAVEEWVDPWPEGGKTSLLDLTGKARNSASGSGSGGGSGSGAAFGSKLDNDGSAGDANGEGKAPAPGKRENGWVCEEAAPIKGVRGVGGDPDGEGTDRLALKGRMGRRETCVVNASIMGRSYYGGKGLVLNKPVVVDIELPVWEEGSVGCVE